MPSSVNFWVGLDVHKESITAAVFRNRDPEPVRVDRLYDLRKVRRYFQRLHAEGAVRACYEASGAGYLGDSPPSPVRRAVGGTPGRQDG